MKIKIPSLPFTEKQKDEWYPLLMGLSIPTIIILLGWWLVSSLTSPVCFYLKPHGTKLYSTNEYRPEIDVREIGGVKFPMIKGSDKLIVFRKSNKSQWVLDSSTKDDVRYLNPPGLKIFSLPQLSRVPEKYHKAILKHNSNNPKTYITVVQFDTPKVESNE